MAKDFVRSILDTEEECKNKESQARKLAEDKKLDAKRQAEKFIIDANKDVDKMLEDDRQAVGKSIELRLEKEKVKVRGECDKLSALADKNRDNVIKLALSSRTG